MIEKKTTKEILHEINLSIVGNRGKYDIINYEKFKTKVWLSKDSLKESYFKGTLLKDLNDLMEKELKDD